MPSLSQLEYIVAVEKFRHFGKAAAACHVTQPTLSMQVQKVEEEIGYQLFDRLKKPILPSAKGRRFIEQAKILLHEHKKLVDLSKRQGSELSGELKIGVIPTLAPYLVPLFIENFSKSYPKVELYIDEMKTNEILQGLKDDTIDAGLLATPLQEAGVRERVLFYEPFSLYVSKNHPLSDRKRIKEDDLHGSEMWLLEDGHCLRNQVVRFCSLKSEEAVFPNIKFEGGNIDTLRNIIRKSSGYTLVPELFVTTLSEREKSEHVREFEKPLPVREVSLVHRRDQWKSDILDALEKSVKQTLPKALKEFDLKRAEIVKIK